MQVADDLQMALNDTIGRHWQLLTAQQALHILLPFASARLFGMTSQLAVICSRQQNCTNVCVRCFMIQGLLSFVMAAWLSKCHDKGGIITHGRCHPRLVLLHAHRSRQCGLHSEGRRHSLHAWQRHRHAAKVPFSHCRPGPSFVCYWATARSAFRAYSAAYVCSKPA